MQRFVVLFFYSLQVPHHVHVTVGGGEVYMGTVSVSDNYDIHQLLFQTISTQY